MEKKGSRITRSLICSSRQLLLKMSGHLAILSQTKINEMIIKECTFIEKGFVKIRLVNIYIQCCEVKMPGNVPMGIENK